jgi:hypothetical protein
MKNPKRVQTPVSLADAKMLLEEYRAVHGSGPHRAATLADVIWPGTKFRAAQGAGAAASRVLKRLGCTWTGNQHNWGWLLYCNSKTK